MPPVPRTPPNLAGLTFVRPIGTGGFADVYLYQQEFPARQVAVKVLRETADEHGIAQFRAEANVMAQLSGHPSIVPIFQADVSAQGHAYLVMEYCPPPHLAQRFRSERLPVEEVLDLGVKIASAVETAHRVGILHRDIKPHNILTSAYGAPLLTDFGIASVAGDAGAGADAVSVPWSPPEVLRAPDQLDVRSDVYSLAATVYSLLASRSPFEIPGGVNDNANLLTRIERQQPSKVLRPDVPDSLNVALARGLAKDVSERQPSAMAFARALQDIQLELDLPMTRLEVLDASPQALRVASTNDARTEVKPISIIVPDELAGRGTLIRPREISGGIRSTSQSHPHRSLPTSPLGRRAQVPAQPSPGGPPVGHPGHEDQTVRVVRPPERSSRWRIVAGLGLALVLATVVGLALVVGDTDAPQVERPDVPTDVPDIVSGPLAPTDLDVRRIEDRLRFTWATPGARPGDRYLVQVGPRLAELAELGRPAEATVEVPATPGAQVCVSVSTIRDSQISDPLTDCVVAAP